VERDLGGALANESFGCRITAPSANEFPSSSEKPIPPRLNALFSGRWKEICLCAPEAHRANQSPPVMPAQPENAQHATGDRRGLGNDGAS
jgi:hypothetical protein